MRATVRSHLQSIESYSGHECVYLNTARPRAPRYLRRFDPDVVFFHYTFLSMRSAPEVFELAKAVVDYLRESPARKVAVPQDEQTRSDLLCEFINSFGVDVVLTPAPAEAWPMIYEGTDRSRLTLRTVLTGYVDESAVRRTAKLARRHHERPIDIGYRSWDPYPFYGRHGRLKGEIGYLFRRRAPEYGLRTNISNDYADALFGDDWFNFLLDCKYTIGVEGGTSMIDRDGSIARRTLAYLDEHPDANFEEVEAACFPGIDGTFPYYALSPRHFEAVMTRTCQILVEGHYGGVLEAGRHYIPLRRDLRNLDEVLTIVRQDNVRAELVDAAYEDVVASGAWTYRRFADEALAAARVEPLAHRGRGATRLWNRIDEAFLAPTVALGSLVRTTREGGPQATWEKTRLVARSRLRRHVVSLRRRLGRSPGCWRSD